MGKEMEIIVINFRNELFCGVYPVASLFFSPPNSPSPYYLLSPSSLLPLIMGCVQSSVVDEEARARALPFYPILMAHPIPSIL